MEEDMLSAEARIHNAVSEMMFRVEQLRQNASEIERAARELEKALPKKLRRFSHER